MTAGKAQGEARRYQELCRDVLVRRFGGMAYSGDGIDVPFGAAGTTFTVDVALNGSGQYDGNIVLAECRKTAQAQKQGQLASFAFEAEKIREATGRPVAAFFMVLRDPQLGALKLSSAELELGGVVRVDGTALPDTQVAFMRYDREREKKIYNYLKELRAGHTQSGTVGAVITRANGTVEAPLDLTGNSEKSRERFARASSKRREALPATRAESGRYGIYTEHLPSEYRLRLVARDELAPVSGKAFAAAHSHDDPSRIRGDSPRGRGGWGAA